MLIDSSGSVLVCALAEGDRIVAEHSADPRGPHIGTAVDAMLRGQSADSIVVGIGPGSFIGTRTAISFANGYTAAGKAALYGVNSLAAIAAAYDQPAAVLRDARRRQWYLWTPDGACVITDESTAVAVLRTKGLREVVIEHAPGNPPPLLAVALNASGFKVAYAAQVPAAGLLRASVAAAPAQYVEPVYLRGFT